jgi:two-component sensor histidine kinase
VAAEDLAQRAAIALDNARLYQATRDANRAKDEFLATVSHELRSPLHAILGWAQMLRDGFHESKRDMALAAIERNATAQAALIDDLLDMSRIVSGTMRLDTAPVRLGPLVMKTLESLKPQLEAKKVILEAAAVESSSVLMGDSSRLQQIVGNLLNNAIKFTPAGGHIVVELTEVDDQVSLTVRDDGKGIDPRFLPHVFDRFKQADGSRARAHGGLGLGLAIVRHLVELHGGTIRASSAGVGRGASFTVTLPQSTATSGPLQRDHRRADLREHVGRLGGIAILVVDDESDAREMMVALLQECGASASSAWRGSRDSPWTIAAPGHRGLESSHMAAREPAKIARRRWTGKAATPGSPERRRAIEPFWRSSVSFCGELGARTMRRIMAAVKKPKS